MKFLYFEILVNWKSQVSLYNCLYLFFGQMLLLHNIHVRPDLLLGVRRFAPYAKEHQQDARRSAKQMEKPSFLHTNHYNDLSLNRWP